MRKKRTKIVATLGPASASGEMLQKMIAEGVDCFRLNFSHSDFDTYRYIYQNIRSAAAASEKEVAVIADLQGPKIRIGSFDNHKINLKVGQILTFDPTCSPTGCTAESIYIDYAAMPQELKSGDILLLDDGLIELVVTDIHPPKIHCRVVVGQELKDRKGINKQGGGLSLSGLSDKDKADLEFAVQLGVDYVAVSFVKTADDIHDVRNLIQDGSVDIISKIECSEAIEHIDEIIEASDSVMVARGDLGVEQGYAKVPGLQKMIIDRARSLNKVVITATQMMESMVCSTIPTRAEVSDVANAVLDGTDAVMLSAETAVGKHPDKVIDAMGQICLQAEMHPRASRSKHRLNRSFEYIDEAIAMATMYTANHLDIKAIICLTESGSTPLWMSRIRSEIPVYGLTRFTHAMRRMSLYRGVYPIAFDATQVSREKLNQSAIDLLLELGHIASGDGVILTKGDFIGASGGTNSMKILCA